MGLAVVADHGSYCGACATVSVSRPGQLSIEKIVLVMNSGHIINPLNCAEQMEGAACWELSHALYGGLQLRGGGSRTPTSTAKISCASTTCRKSSRISLFRRMLSGAGSLSRAVHGPAGCGRCDFLRHGKRIRSTPISKHDLELVLILRGRMNAGAAGMKASRDHAPTQGNGWRGPMTWRERSRYRRPSLR
jgi:isoquinoline 1-oxidoreductase subunit beta